jgi:DNA repair exonuclease SbcCD nuclease subunit
VKVLFSADWHIKLKTKGIPDTWAINRYKLLFEKLHELEGHVALHIIGGDLFDRTPTPEEQELFFEFVLGCKCKTLIYAGNHEAKGKHTTFLSNYKQIVNAANPLVEIIDSLYTIENMDIIPYNQLKNWVANPTYGSGNICLSHFRGDIPPHVKAEVPLELFDHYEVVFAGDLHSHDCCQRNIVYPGSPITTSFHRSLVDTGVVLFDLNNPKAYESLSLGLPQLIRKTIKAGESMPATDYHHTIYEVTGDISELGAIETSELLDKKLVKRDSDTALILTHEMSMQDEFSEYLQYILGVQGNGYERLMKLYNDTVKNA